MQQNGQKPKLRKRVSDRIETLQLSPKTFDKYWSQIRKFLIWHRDRAGRWIEPEDMGSREVEAYLTHLAVNEKVAADTQNGAFYAIVFLYKKVLGIDLEGIDACRAKRTKPLPRVLSVEVVRKLLGAMHGRKKLVACLLYGCALRIGECLRIRLKDVQLDRLQIHIHCSKGKKDRIVPIPPTLVEPIQWQIDHVRRVYAWDQENGGASITLPHAYGRKGNWSSSLAWYFLFCAAERCNGKQVRHHMHETVIQREVKAAASRAGIVNRVTPHMLRHSCATHMLDSNHDLRTIQDLLGHDSVETTQRYTHVRLLQTERVRSPLEDLKHVLAKPPRRLPLATRPAGTRRARSG